MSVASVGKKPNGSSPTSLATQNSSPELTRQGSASSVTPSKPNADGKMQQLIVLARERIREQKADLAVRDAQIADLEQAIEKFRALVALTPEQEASRGPPVRALCQVTEKSVGLSSDKGRWVLFEFEELGSLEWLRFENLARLEDFVRRDPGSEPIELPEPVLTLTEARQVRERAELAVAKIADDFRKYRVQTEIQRKQREALHREATAMREILAAEVDDASPEPTLPKVDDSLRMRIAELEDEVERLSKGPVAEAAQAAEWRRRYELAVEKHDKHEAEIRALRTAGADSSEYAALAQKHEELRKEFKSYRSQALKALRAQEQQADRSASNSGPSRTLDALGERNAPPSRRRAADESLAKLQYLKNLMLNYLASTEPKAREHMERAIATILAFNKEELARIDSAKLNSSSFF